MKLVVYEGQRHEKWVAWEKEMFGQNIVGADLKPSHQSQSCHGVPAQIGSPSLSGCCRTVSALDRSLQPRHDRLPPPLLVYWEFGSVWH